MKTLKEAIKCVREIEDFILEKGGGHHTLEIGEASSNTYGDGKSYLRTQIQFVIAYKR